MISSRKISSANNLFVDSVSGASFEDHTQKGIELAVECSSTPQRARSNGMDGCAERPAEGKGVRVVDAEDIASHTAPESCVASCEPAHYCPVKRGRYAKRRETGKE